MSQQRRNDVDWLRAIAIIIMIEAHVFDAWTRADVRASQLFSYAMILAGFAAPAFLFLAGLSTVLAVSRKRPVVSEPYARRVEGRAGEDAGAAARAVRRRGWQIFGLAFLFRAQSISLDARAYLSALLSVDILNIMGPSIVLSGVVLGTVNRRSRQLATFAAMAAAFTMLAPVVRVAPWLSGLPDPLESYLRPQPGHAAFALFPWAGFLFAGSAVGLLINRERAVASDRTFNSALLAAGAVLAGASYGASYLPSIYARSTFWTTSPTFFFLRVGILVMAVALARLLWLRLQMAPVGRFDRRALAALEPFGRSSLLVYWVHVDIVYGLLMPWLHGTLSFWQVTAAFALVTLLMFVLVVLENRVVALRRARRAAKERTVRPV